METESVTKRTLFQRADLLRLNKASPCPLQVDGNPDRSVVIEVTHSLPRRSGNLARRESYTAVVKGHSRAFPNWQSAKVDSASRGKPKYRRSRTFGKTKFKSSCKFLLRFPEMKREKSSRFDVHDRNGKIAIARVNRGRQS